MAVVVLAALGWALWPAPGLPPVATSVQDVSVPGGPGSTGPVQLDTTLYLPARVPAPAVILAHGFGGTKNSVADQAQQLARDGFVVLAYSARGFGRSTGQIALDSLDYEVSDARALVSWLAQRPQQVLQDAPGDPRVGVTGGSYGGALALMLAGTDPRVDAVAAVATWNDLSQALFPNDGVVGSPPAGPGTPAAQLAEPDGVFKKSWAAALMTSVISGVGLTAGVGSISGAPAASPGTDSRTSTDTPTGTDSPAGTGPTAATDGSTNGQDAGTAQGPPTVPGCGRMLPALCAAYATVAQTGRITPELAALLARSSPVQVAGDITAPTLLVQGEKDTLFGLDQADANAREIAANGTPVAVSWYAGGHDGGGLDGGTQDRITNWLRHYLLGTGATPSTAFQYTVSGSLSDTGRSRSRTLQLPRYPGLDGGTDTPLVTLPLTGKEQAVLNPPGGSPAAISSLPGLGTLGNTALGALAGGLPGQTASFSSAPLGAAAVVSGSSRITLSVAAVPGAGGAGSGVLYASIGSLTASGSFRLAGGAVAPVRISALPADGSAATVTVALPAVAFQVEAGSRVQVRISTTDQAYAGPLAPAVYRISLGGDSSLTIPEAGGVRVSAGEVPVPLVVALIVLVLVAAAGLVLAGRIRRRPTDPPVRDAELPLLISRLRKSYPGGVVAVDDVSFEVRSGQVLGLLGPNGAGKTTTLRMVMGLIYPSGGEIKVFGQPVRPGAEILSRIGSFVEGAGFLPHLSGRDNLQLYWRASGRPTADAHLAEALEIAGLGTAIRRRVKTYSQGMRQRLAIAQAMLGLPDLLLLDEPTNGLDPPQIHAMREVLSRYAATGRTVLISSHLLSEVEQTCSHVVIVHRGRTIAEGTVADMIAASGETTFTVDDPVAAAAVLSALPGVGEVAPNGSGVTADLGPGSTSTALRALLDAGVTVTAAAPRNRLEDVFLELVGSSTTADAELPMPGAAQPSPELAPSQSRQETRG